MALIEPKSNIIASSVDNFYIFNNQHYQDVPYVTITVNSFGGDNTLTITDRENASDYSLSINGGATLGISTSSYNTSISTEQTMYSLIECLKRNSLLFYDITVLTPNSFRMNIDASRNYKITSSTNQLLIGGTYSSYNSSEYAKFVLMMNGVIDANNTTLTLDKYTNSRTVSFNIGNPFQYTNLTEPLSLNLSAYSVYDGIVAKENITRNSIKIMPTTLTKFEDFDFSPYYYQTSQNEPKMWLTTNKERHYNYGEVVALSFLSDISDDNYVITHKYYTNGGVFLTSRTDLFNEERHDIRMDFYLRFALDEVESMYNHQVGFVDVVMSRNGLEISDVVRYEVHPKCKSNHTVYFLNKIGGVDSFNFVGKAEYSSSISNSITSMKNPLNYFLNDYEIEYQVSLSNDVTYTFNDNVSKETAEWLNELSKSKHVYAMSDNAKYTLVVSKMDIKTNDREDTFDVSLMFHYSDNKITL